MVKRIKDIFLWYRKADDLETVYTALSTRVLPSLFKWCPWLTITYFTARSNLVPYAFVWEKVKTVDFSETIKVHDIKVGRCSQLNESFMSTKGQGHSLTLVQITQIQYFKTFFSSITADFNISSALRWAIQDQWSSGIINQISIIIKHPTGLVFHGFTFKTCIPSDFIAYFGKQPLPLKFIGIIWWFPSEIGKKW